MMNEKDSADQYAYSWSSIQLILNHCKWVGPKTLLGRGISIRANIPWNKNNILLRAKKEEVLGTY